MQSTVSINTLFYICVFKRKILINSLTDETGNYSHRKKEKSPKISQLKHITQKVVNIIYNIVNNVT